MEIKPIGPVLSGLTVPLRAPELIALATGNELYTVLALQPKGTLRIETDSIARATPAEETAAFLRMSAELAVALTIAPEYSVSWTTLIECLRQGIRPRAGCMWVLGCESLRLSSIDSIKEDLADTATVVHEPLNWLGRTTQEYVNPLAYVFEAERFDGEGTQLVVLMQFKTAPSGDGDNTEARGMLPGKDVYIFGENDAERRVKLLTLICSDSFDFTGDLIAQYADELLMLHIQLNNKPYDAQYASYRTALFRSNTHTELICLNWASGTNYVVAQDDATKPLVAYTGSAWYRRTAAAHLTDERINQNDAKGFYFTFDKGIRTAALQFTAIPCALLIRSTKVFHHNVPAAASNLTGPEVEQAYIWSPGDSRWVEVEAIDDGFPDTVRSCSPYFDELGLVHKQSPINVDRIAAITSGLMGTDDWYKPLELESLQLGGQEMVRRLTLRIDSRSDDFREVHLAPMRNLAELQAEGFNWPSEVDFLSDGFVLQWHRGQPHRNVATAREGKRKYATVALSSSSRPAYLDMLDRKIRKVVYGRPARPDEDLTDDELAIREAEHYRKPRNVCVLYLKAAKLVPVLNSFSTDIGRPATIDDVSFADASFRRSTDAGE